ncbi:uridylate kinase ura6 [Aspergillus clavatus NRRL 1]|uniref:Uridylate kinase n=1 Tax=Aspergillus clavatus (strain ATCC 1007 / CBS 513.65 / DSM 816 / NCTC 3887 / NRRL 1 / QM 1276 / 107) TaxID=344612 RepID=A1CD86_ASPCL|nr:uridylate kinase Ura6 [Aspergillus clavatus NRRL 1]EAW11813.1 uridylate kinase Ura6 [Aspergillus clavatus NRRL 1]
MANTENPPAIPPHQPTPPLTSTNTTPRFSPEDVTVVFLLGGPGSGKGTQSANLVRDYGFVHLSAGDLLRAEQVREGSQYGDLIRTYIREGKIVPMEITVALLSNAMADALATGSVAGGPSTTGQKKKARFLVDGFPRKLDQAVFFEDTVCPSEMTLFLDCPEEVMETRLLKRGETSGRDDDNAESIRKRFRVFVETSMPVVRAFAEQHKVLSASATGTVDEVYARIQEGLEKRGMQPI